MDKDTERLAQIKAGIFALADCDTAADVRWLINQLAAKRERYRALVEVARAMDEFNQPDLPLDWEMPIGEDFVGSFETALEYLRPTLAALQGEEKTDG